MLRISKKREMYRHIPMSKIKKKNKKFLSKTTIKTMVIFDFLAKRNELLK